MTLDPKKKKMRMAQRARIERPIVNNPKTFENPIENTITYDQNF